ncbi:hypothetical protein TREMEDRAFT_63261 [Tremella mesenterica DSM 1558]|uniref:uncharacterized protein n=1 Tax=Tremella mesenterica (strain ATCC 24925 / CBS 8224 / DSM 1558 / NBRC 9311 / NRRL Y-6157 / RJB 2259-6 / UBC 559-6) TaxID=578456 RepID=UPI0003F4A437|nr:uncharacterized protein TREMEDRAFT_63261 [Tremella mesenterica DSM 1558]EIW68798.1 hypothetical protein TREMEDRAFT_63261 [Tremella mesenterica DSM 1558]
MSIGRSKSFHQGHMVLYSMTPQCKPHEFSDLPIRHMLHRVRYLLTMILRQQSLGSTQDNQKIGIYKHDSLEVNIPKCRSSKLLYRWESQLAYTTAAQGVMKDLSSRFVLLRRAAVSKGLPSDRLDELEQLTYQVVLDELLIRTGKSVETLQSVRISQWGVQIQFVDETGEGTLSSDMSVYAKTETGDIYHVQRQGQVHVPYGCGSLIFSVPADFEKQLSAHYPTDLSEGE